MTDVLERDDTRIRIEPTSHAAVPAAPARLRTGSALVLATLSGGAGAIHLAVAPTHWGGSTLEGLLFATAGWLQIAIAVSMFTAVARRVFPWAIGLNVALIFAWVIDRAEGLPFGAHAHHAEKATFVDIACVLLEVAFIAVAAFVWRRPRAQERGRRGLIVGVVASIAVLALATAALASPSARNPAALAPRPASAFAVAADGHTHSHGGTNPVDDKGFSQLHNGAHQHIVLTKLDPQTQKKLDAQLAVTREVARKTPTVAAAEKAGYRRVGPYLPGIGAHYWRPLGGAGGLAGPAFNPDGVIDNTDLRNPLMLIFDGTKPTSKIAGFMYYSMADHEPEGFAGRNDFWHYHEQLCLKFAGGGAPTGTNALGAVDVPFGLDNSATEAQCKAVGGWMLKASQYMVHVWSVPGFEMTDEYGGVFGEENPKLACGDGTYYTLPVKEWATHQLNVCKVP